MSVKIDNVIAHYNAHGRVVVKLDRSSGFSSITVTKRNGGGNIVGTVPGGKLISYTDSEVRNLLEANRIYVISWGN